MSSEVGVCNIIGVWLSRKEIESLVLEKEPVRGCGHDIDLGKGFKFCPECGLPIYTEELTEESEDIWNKLVDGSWLDYSVVRWGLELQRFYIGTILAEVGSHGRHETNRLLREAGHKTPIFPDDPLLPLERLDIGKWTSLRNQLREDLGKFYEESRFGFHSLVRWI